MTCDDDNACTADSCAVGAGCINTPITCDDDSICTDDTCDTASGCVYTPNDECTASPEFPSLFLPVASCIAMYAVATLGRLQKKH